MFRPVPTGSLSGCLLVASCAIYFGVSLNDKHYNYASSKNYWLIITFAP